MIKVKEIQEEGKVVEMRDMKPLQIGEIVEGNNQGDIVFRVPSCDDRRYQVITIAGKTHMWMWHSKYESGPTTKVRLFPPGTKVIWEVTE